MLRVLVHINANSFKTMMTFGNIIYERLKSIRTVRVLDSVMGVAIICALRYELRNYSNVSELIDIDNILQPTYLKHRENSGALILTFGLKMEGVWPDIMQTIFVTCACIGKYTYFGFASYMHDNYIDMRFISFM